MALRRKLGSHAADLGVRPEPCLGVLTPVGASGCAPAGSHVLKFICRLEGNSAALPFRLMSWVLKLYRIVLPSVAPPRGLKVLQRTA